MPLYPSTASMPQDHQTPHQCHDSSFRKGRGVGERHHFDGKGGGGGIILTSEWEAQRRRGGRGAYVFFPKGVPNDIGGGVTCTIHPFLWADHHTLSPRKLHPLFSPKHLHFVGEKNSFFCHLENTVFQTRPENAFFIKFAHFLLFLGGSNNHSLVQNRRVYRSFSLKKSFVG